MEQVTEEVVTEDPTMVAVMEVVAVATVTMVVAMEVVVRKFSEHLFLSLFFKN